MAIPFFGFSKTIISLNLRILQYLNTEYMCTKNAYFRARNKKTLPGRNDKQLFYDLNAQKLLDSAPQLVSTLEVFLYEFPEDSF